MRQLFSRPYLHPTREKDNRSIVKTIAVGACARDSQPAPLCFRSLDPFGRRSRRPCLFLLHGAGPAVAQQTSVDRDGVQVIYPTLPGFHLDVVNHKFQNQIGRGPGIPHKSRPCGRSEGKVLEESSPRKRSVFLSIVALHVVICHQHTTIPLHQPWGQGSDRTIPIGHETDNARRVTRFLLILGRQTLQAGLFGHHVAPVQRIVGVP